MSALRCPHCGVSFHYFPTRTWIEQDLDGAWGVAVQKCPACHRCIIHLERGKATKRGGRRMVDAQESILVRPKGTSRPPEEVPEAYAEDYTDACLVLGDSPKASAALSRRCLQNILRDVAKVKPGNLFDEIQEFLDSRSPPSHIAEAVDAIRNVGNFAAHPIKSEKTGEILGVEPGEAEWNLDVLESVFDFYFVQPALLQKKREALDAKLKEAGKPPMK